MSRRARPLLALLLVAGVLSGCFGSRGTGGSGEGGEATADSPGVLEGRIVDEAGQGVAHASIDLGDVTVEADAQGRFRAAVQGGPRLVTARADGHLPRTQAVAPGVPVRLSLTGDAAATLSLRVGGDVMFGRRYYDRNDDGDRGDGLLGPAASVADHASLLARVQPLLADADVTVVNLETPLISDPWFDPRLPRPAKFHPTKEFAFASAPESARALADSGVDVVSLGNNHLFDALQTGVDSTLKSLDEAGIAHFGAGRTVAEAWAPALVERKGQRLAFLGCTTITGTEHAITYVATDEQGGAAQCSRSRLRSAVQAARERADTVVVMVHGGEEYESDQTDLVRDLTEIAQDAGAGLVINGHPHVVGGVTLEGRTLIAETMGNLLFNQTVWPTFVSYLLRADIRHGSTVVATVDPLLLDDYRPRATVGLLADTSARRAAGFLPGPLRLQQPGAVYTAHAAEAGERVHRELPAGSVARLASGWWVPAGDAAVMLGEDLLWTGSFEDMDTDGSTSGAHHWALSGNAARTSAAACSGSSGVEMRRAPVSAEEVVLSPAHRQLLPRGESLNVSLLADVRRASAGGTLELALFKDTKGGSFTRHALPIPEGRHEAGACRRVRLDVAVPAGVVAMQPFGRLAPSGDNVRSAHLAVDDVQLIAWAPPGAAGRRYDTVGATSTTRLELVNDRPGTGGEPFVEQGALAR